MNNHRFISRLLDGIGRCNMMPDNRSCEEILKDYHGDTTVMLFMIIGFALITTGLLSGFFLIMSGYVYAGTVVSMTTLAVWFYAQIRKIKHKKKS